MQSTNSTNFLVMLLNSNSICKKN